MSLLSGASSSIVLSSVTILDDTNLSRIQTFAISHELKIIQKLNDQKDEHEKDVRAIGKNKEALKNYEECLLIKKPLDVRYDISYYRIRIRIASIT